MESATRARILVIADEAGIRRALTVMLHSLGDAVDTAADLHTGLAMLVRQLYEGVIADASIPHLTGWEIVYAVKRFSPGVPVVLISGPSTELENLTEHEVQLLPRHFGIEDVERAIRVRTPTLRDLHARTRLATCPRCGRPLSAGSLLYQGDELVHALCWRDTLWRAVADVSQESAAVTQQSDEAPGPAASV